jgi:hypothetical protein
MYIVKTIEQYDDSNLILCEPIKNNIMIDGQFIRIMYSTQNMTMNGVYLLIQLNDVVCEKYYNKYKCIFNIMKHKELIEKIKTIEETILKKYNIKKIPFLKIYEQIRYGFIKIFNDIGNQSQYNLVLKISGIWETETNYGLTYKFC